MTHFAVTIVWDVDAEGEPEEIEGAPTAVSHGRLTTTVYLDAPTLPQAAEWAVLKLLNAMAPSQPLAYAVEPVSATPHFAFGIMGR
jgi:hypothetical protein